jgi:hypothetical protein
MTTNRPERGGRWRRLGLLALLAGLAACGPGTGGTGTGPNQGTLGFSGNAGTSVVPPPGSDCQARCGEVSLQLQEQRVELVAECRRFVYAGNWDVGANGELVLNGAVETTTATGTATTAATLRLQFSEGEAASSQVTAVLSGDGAAILLGPAALLRGEVSLGAPAPGCAKLQ